MDRNKGSLSTSKRLNTGQSTSFYQSSYDDEEFDYPAKKPSVDVSRMSLDEYLRRYTSEDNQAFVDIHEKDRQEFLKKVAWMFNESEKQQKLN